MEELPKKSSEPVDQCYSIMLTKRMKSALEEMKTFESVDVPKWIRSMLEDALKKMGKI